MCPVFLTLVFLPKYSWLSFSLLETSRLDGKFCGHGHPPRKDISKLSRLTVSPSQVHATCCHHSCLLPYSSLALSRSSPLSFVIILPPTHDFDTQVNDLPDTLASILLTALILSLTIHPSQALRLQSHPSPLLSLPT